MKYNFALIEKKWQKEWEKRKVFQSKEKKGKKKFYVLDMFPYPSGQGLHIGHAFVFSIGDIYARFKRLQGYNVLYPIGYDSLGLPAENAAIKSKTHPEVYTKKSIANFMKQQKAMGWSYDWSRMLYTHNPEFYKWDQWIFLQMLKKGFAYRKKAAVNWCNKCNSVLANEQVVNGKCWRHDNAEVEVKDLEQWFLKITEYADELVKGLDKLDWPERAKIMQKNWIGRKEWIDIDYEIEGTKEKITVSTTRPDTNFGATSVVMAPEHPLFSQRGIIPEKCKKNVEEYIRKAKEKTEMERLEEGKKKTGVFTGLYCINQLTKKKMPIWITDFVMMSVGTGAVVGVPGHDKRDFEFAKEFNLPIIRVVVGKDKDESEIKKKEQVQEAEGTIINSNFLNGLDIHKATKKVMDYLEEKGWGRRTIRYRLKDWLISRQRYWGTPIPVVYCDKCGIVPVAEKDLPINLPEKVKFGKGNPLESAKSWMNVKCPNCKGPGRRETDTMDTFANSSWYYLKYCDPKNKKKIFDSKKINYWCPVDQYIGGPEHITMHLIYVRFYAKFLRDLGILSFDEPALRYFTQGIVHAADGSKMSKSKGNIVEPLDMINKYGADTLRLGLISFASPDKDTSWDEKVVLGSHKFLIKVSNYFDKVKIGNVDARTESKLNKTIKEVTEYIEDFKYNLAIIKIRELFDRLPAKTSKNVLEKFLKILSPFCPHITEELWSKLRNKKLISLSDWPKFDKKKINEKFEKEEEAVSKVVSDIINIKKFVSEAKKAFIYVIPNEKEAYVVDEIEKRVGLKVQVFAVNDKTKYDPEGKSKKTKPGKPGIYLE